MKNIFQHDATLWDFCVKLMRKDSLFLPQNAQTSAEKIRADTCDTWVIRGDKEPL